MPLTLLFTVNPQTLDCEIKKTEMSVYHVVLNSSLVFCCFQQVADMHSHLLSCLHLDLSEIKSFSCSQTHIHYIML